MANPNRKLATIQEVISINPIEGADRIVVAKILGWDVVVPKGQLEIGDKVVYFEIDSFLPVDKRWEFLEKTSKRKHRVTGEEGIRIKSIKLRGQISQGLVLPFDIFEELDENLPVGTDVTNQLNVKIWEVPEIVGNLGRTKSKFHEVIQKTDEIRGQSDNKFLDALVGKPYYISEKVDGSSITIVHEDGKNRIFTRNMEILDGESSIWDFFRKKGIIEAFDNLENVDIAFQGEIYGPGIQSNRLKVKETCFNFFNIVNPKTNERYNFKDWDNILIKTNLKGILNPVKILEIGDNFNYTLNELQEKSNGNYDNAGQREGIVIRPQYENELLKELSEKDPKWKQESRFSFKVINNKYLIKWDE